MQDRPRRFRIRMDPWWRPAFFIIGATPSRCYADLDTGTLAIRMGFFRFRLPRARIISAAPVPGRLWHGIGIHSDFTGGWAINGSLAGMVELRLAPGVRLPLLGIPLACTQLFVNFDDPEAFLQALAVPLPTAASSLR